MSTSHGETNHDGSRRSCPYCGETIKSVAKICPRCRQWLTFLSWRNPAVFLFSVIVTTLVVGLMLASHIERIWDPKPHYDKAANALRVVESRTTWWQTKSDRRIQLTGIITNETDVPWRAIELECRFFDTNGVLIDVAHPLLHQTLQPKDDAAFSALVFAARPTNTYARHAVTVISARNDKNAL